MSSAVLATFIDPMCFRVRATLAGPPSSLHPPLYDFLIFFIPDAAFSVAFFHFFFLTVHMQTVLLISLQGAWKETLSLSLCVHGLYKCTCTQHTVAHCILS